MAQFQISKDPSNHLRLIFALTIDKTFLSQKWHSAGTFRDFHIKPLCRLRNLQIKKSHPPPSRGDSGRARQQELLFYRDMEESPGVWGYPEAIE